MPARELTDDHPADRVRQCGEHLIEGDLLDVGVRE